MNIKSLFDSSVQENFSPQQTLTLIGLAGLVSLIMAFVPGLGWLDYPFRLLLTMAHELGHGLAALLTGGEFVRFVIFPNGAGLAYTAGGWRWLIVPAGYVGVALFGAALIALGRSHRWSRIAMGVIGAAC
ncbi:MAG: M50 family metallopeptidase [Chloroflexi bacterium]|nr:M50 family metallopeptidase [Chloroflexota bacterium]